MPKVLLVEDDNNLREIYEARLQAEGYDIVSASDGEEALATAKTEKPDLVVSDVMMPKISGFEMLDILRNTDGLKDVKVIMLTALGQAEDKTRADQLGADRYLVKSQVTLEDIVISAHQLLDKPEDTAAPASEPVEASSEPAVTAPIEATAPSPQVSPALEAVANQPVEPPTAPAAPEPAVAPITAAPVVTPVVLAPAPEPVAVLPEVAVTPIPASEPVELPAPAPTVAEPAVTPAPAIDTNQVPAPVAAQITPASDASATSPAVVDEDAASTAEEQAAMLEQISTFVAEATPQPEATPTADEAPAAPQPVDEPAVNPAPVAASEPALSPAPAIPVTAPVAAEPAAPVVPVSAPVSTPSEPILAQPAAAPVEQATPASSGLSDALKSLSAPDRPSEVTATEVPADPSQLTVGSPAAAMPRPAESAPVATTAPATAEATPAIRKKVIQPLNDINAKPDLESLLAVEAAKEAASQPQQAVVNGRAIVPAPTPVAPEQAADAVPNEPVVPEPVPNPALQLSPELQAATVEPEALAAATATQTPTPPPVVPIPQPQATTTIPVVPAPPTDPADDPNNIAL